MPGNRHAIITASDTQSTKGGRLVVRHIWILVLAFVLAAATALAAATPRKAPASHAVERGKYLVQIGSCNDCHTPWKMGPQGPGPDLARMLMGHPQGVKSPAPALPAGPWDTATGGMTAWAGPWGISYAVNLTPDKNTGLGSWSEAMFVEAMQTGRHWGKGRPILPPCPGRTGPTRRWKT